MATIDLRVGGTTALPASESIRSKLLVQRIRFAETTVTSSDVVSLFNIPAGCLVQGVYLTTVTAQGGAMTVNVGDAGSAVRYLASADINATAGTMVAGDASTGSTAGASTLSYLYAAAGVIQLVTSGTPTIAVIDVKVLVLDLTETGARGIKSL